MQKERLIRYSRGRVTILNMELVRGGLASAMRPSVNCKLRSSQQQSAAPRLVSDVRCKNLGPIASI
jgi:hypothetical protein